MEKKRFTELGLSPELLKAIDKIGFEEASPIQSAAIPVLLEGKDIVGQSQTGSGKTAAFAIPAIERVEPGLHAPQALILCPTRELAVQVAEEVARLAAFKRGVRELPIYGGQSYERQFRGLQHGAQIIIGTPGRIMDHLERGSLKLEHVRMVILDEADRMLDMGFVADIEAILSQVPEERQTVFFSATLPRPIQQLIQNFSRDPVQIRIATPELSVPSIEQIYYEVDRRSKIEALCRIIDLQDVRFGIVFCATKMMVDDLTEHLTARGYSADKLHGDMSQAMRERVMNKFKKRSIEFLVATDVAARGIDIDDIEVVFNYDLPQDGEDYVHRIGRTGRAGRSGRAITFVAGREIYKLQNIMRFTKGRIRRERVPSADEVEEKRAYQFFEQLKELLEKGDYRKRDELIDRLLEQGHAATDIASALIHMLGAEKRAVGETGSAVERPAAGSAEPRGRGRREERDEKPSRSFREPQERPVKSFAERPGSRKAVRGERLPEEPQEAGWQEERPSRQATHMFKARGEGIRPERERERGGREVRSKSHEAGMVRLVLNVGKASKVMPGDIVGMIAGTANIPGDAIGAIQLLPKTTLVDVRDEYAGTVVKKLRNARLKGRKVFIDFAD